MESQHYQLNTLNFKVQPRKEHPLRAKVSREKEIEHFRHLGLDLTCSSKNSFQVEFHYPEETEEWTWRDYFTAILTLGFGAKPSEKELNVSIYDKETGSFLRSESIVYGRITSAQGHKPKLPGYRVQHEKYGFMADYQEGVQTVLAANAIQDLIADPGLVENAIYGCEKDADCTVIVVDCKTARAVRKENADKNKMPPYYHQAICINFAPPTSLSRAVCIKNRCELSKAIK